MLDLRSDTLTMPDQEMLATILTAQLGDDGRTDAEGRGEDKTVNALENLAAAITGKEAALLFPTGTLANTCGVLSMAQPGEKILVHEQQHLLLTEKFLFEYCAMQPIKYSMDSNVIPDVAMIEKLLAESGAKLICLENTHNFSGGYCIPVTTMQNIRQVAVKYGARIHLDGARIFHAAAALNVEVKELAATVDSLMFCISKGLGAPVGSLLCGTQKQIAKARSIRRFLGGGMRQAGIIAAPGIYALRHNVKRLQEDIDNARLTGSLLRGRLHRIVLQADVQSNILVLDLKNAAISPEAFCQLAEASGLLIKPVLSTCVRLVFYKGITQKDARSAAEIILGLDSKL